MRRPCLYFLDSDFLQKKWWMPRDLECRRTSGALLALAATILTSCTAPTGRSEPMNSGISCQQTIDFLHGRSALHPVLRAEGNSRIMQTCRAVPSSCPAKTYSPGPVSVKMGAAVVLLQPQCCLRQAVNLSSASAQFMKGKFLSSHSYSIISSWSRCRAGDGVRWHSLKAVHSYR
jgi:hypothetical protein